MWIKHNSAAVFIVYYVVMIPAGVFYDPDLLSDRDTSCMPIEIFPVDLSEKDQGCYAADSQHYTYHYAACCQNHYRILNDIGINIQLRKDTGIP